MPEYDEVLHTAVKMVREMAGILEKQQQQIDALYASYLRLLAAMSGQAAATDPVAAPAAAPALERVQREIEELERLFRREPAEGGHA